MIHGVRRIERLKIDTQGSDFTLLQSVLDNAGGTSPLIVDSVQLECQNEKQTPRFYERSNDCAAIADYFRMRHPAYRLQSTHRQLRNSQVQPRCLTKPRIQPRALRDSSHAVPAQRLDGNATRGVARRGEVEEGGLLN